MILTLHFREENKENISLIIKSMREGLVSALVEQMNLFPKEIDMFVNIIPEMAKIYGNVIFFYYNYYIIVKSISY